MYIGSSKDIIKRFRRHIYDLRNKRHHSQHLQRAWDKYGEKSFIFMILEELDEDKLIYKEQEYLDRIMPWNEQIGYNMSKKASGNALYGEKASRSKLTNQEVEEIKIKVIKNNINPKDLSSVYNVSTDTIRRIINGSTYSDVRPDLIREKNVECHYVTKNNGEFIVVDHEENRKAIIDLFNSGLTPLEISKMGFKRTTIVRTLQKFCNYKTKKKRSIDEVLLDRKIIITMYIDGKSQKEIRNLTNISKSIVEKTVNGYKNKRYDINGNILK